METLSYQNITRDKEIEQENKNRLLKLNQKLNDKSGIYFLLREIEEILTTPLRGKRNVKC